MKDILFSLRKLKRNKLLLYVGIPGLTIGLSVVLLLICYLRREYSFDKHFATKNRVVRLYIADKSGEYGTFGISLRDSYEKIPSKVAEVESAVQIFNDRISSLKVVETGETYPDVHSLYADNEFFDVFAQKLIHGNASDALKGKNKVVLSETTALKYFGTTDCVGKQLEMEAWSAPQYIVTGVVKELPDNSHFNFELLVSMETLPLNEFNMEFQTYYLIKKGTDVSAVSGKIEKANNEVMKPFCEEVGLSAAVSETRLLKDVHFFTESRQEIVPTIEPYYLWLVAGIALLVLLIALANFVNLYVIHTNMRINEAAMRKSLGASQAGLARLFFSDTLIMSMLAFVIAVFLTNLATPYLSKILNSRVSIYELFSVEGSLAVVTILLIIIFVSGIYPLLSISKNNLALGVKGKTQQVKRKSFVTQTALMLQFSITAFLLVAVIIFYSQMQYMKSIPLGFNPENLELFPATSRVLGEKMGSIKEEVRKFPFVESVATSDHQMGGSPSGQNIANYGSDKSIPINEYRVTPGFAETMQLNLVAGSFFAETAENEIILNEAAVKKLELQDPAGKLVMYRGKPATIKGVVEDFYYTENSGKNIEPLVLTPYVYYEYLLYVRTSQKISAVQRLQIASVFKEFDDTYVLKSHSVNDFYAGKFKEEEKTLKLAGTGTLLAILLSISGLVALSLLNVNRRTKEIGVRKIMGSTEWQILKMLIGQALVWIFAACFIGFLISYWVMYDALQNFVNRITITPIYFIISGLIILLITLLAIGWQSWYAATRNPVEALRYE